MVKLDSHNVKLHCGLGWLQPLFGICGRNLRKWLKFYIF
jgi:hypothetical protein